VLKTHTVLHLEGGCTEKPLLDGLVLDRQKAVNLAQLGPAYLVTAWPGSQPEAQHTRGTTVVVDSNRISP
jgi:hypothetical protein